MSEISRQETLAAPPRTPVARNRRSARSYGVFRSLDRGDASTSLPERYVDETRAVQLDETLKLAKFSALAHVAVTACYVGFFWPTPGRAFTLSLCIAVSTLVIAALCSAIVCAPRIASARSVDIGRVCATLVAFLMGSAWGTMPVALLPMSDLPHQMIVCCTIVGVISDVFVLGPILPLSLLFVFPVLVGTYIGLIMAGGWLMLMLSILLTIYALFVSFSIKEMNKLSVQRIVDRVRVSEQNDTIGLLLRDFEENTADWLWEVDAEGRFHHVSERIAQSVGVAVSILQHVPFSKIFTQRLPHASISDGARKILTAIAGRRPFHNMPVEIKTPDASIWWLLTGKPIYDKSGLFIGYRGVGSDITVARNAEEKIAYMANFDTLTGLANRAVFLTLASQECEVASRDRSRRALLYLDLDGFKGVNDSLGHAIGDKLLQEVAGRLKEGVPKTAVLARLGGDEFAVLYRVTRRNEAEALAEGLIERLSAPYHIDEFAAEIGLSVGIAFSPDDSAQPDALLVKADLALYRAKADGKGRYRVFVEEYERSLNDRRAFESDLRLALPRRELELAYQPLVELGQGRVVCFEALLRWNSPARGLVSPVAFIPVAETIGLIVSIGRWVLWQACTDAARWDADVSIAVNISPQHFRMPDFLNDVAVALEVSGLDPTRLEIEITEGVFLEGCPAALENLHALRRRGIRIALDDFGTGYSSLNYLINFPVDKIKIDRSFVRDFISRHENRAIIDAILTLARELSIKVTAEGVETVEQAVALRARRCDDIQGYLLSVPRPASAVTEMIESIPATFRDVMPARAAAAVKMVQKQKA